MNTSLKAISQFYQGISGAPGRGVGPVYQWQRVAAGAGSTYDDPEGALRAAIATAEEHLRQAAATADAKLASLLDAQRLMLGDPELTEAVFAQVAAGIDPVLAVAAVSGEMAGVLEASGSEYFRERAIDVRAVGQLIIEMLTGTAKRVVPNGAVVIAEELSPLDTAGLSESGTAAIVTVRGGPTCHAAILARAWGIPAVVGAPAEVLQIPDHVLVLVDGTNGRIIVNPPPELRAAPVEDKKPAVHITRRIPIYANIGSVAEVRRALEAGAEGIGLLRTEFLFQRRSTAPSEDEQAVEYTEILRQMGGKPVIVRLLDIGADKPVPYLKMPAEPNPQLGLRGARLFRREPALLETQLRALLRATTSGTLKIMLPMVATAAEVQAVRAQMTALAAALGVAPPPLGAMIEVPMAALAADELAAACDFFSIGTNDLLQFLLAADRQNADVSYLYDGDHPAAWRLLGQVIAAAHAAHIPAGICGEWAADPAKLVRLVELGIDSASVSVGALKRVRAAFE